MSQKVRIERVKHTGAPVFLGLSRLDPDNPDTPQEPEWTTDPERIMEWLCDGWRFRYNQHRAERGRYAWEPDPDNEGKYRHMLDADGEKILYPLGDDPNFVKDSTARKTWLFLSALPAMVLQSPERIESKEWFAATKRRDTLAKKGKNPGAMPEFKSYKKHGQSFVCWHNGGTNATVKRLNRNHVMVTISGQNPTEYVTDGARFQVQIIVRSRQEIRPYTSVNVDWTKRSLVFVNEPLPVRDAIANSTGAFTGLDRGVVHNMADATGGFYDLPASIGVLDRQIKHLQKQQDRAVKVAGFKNQRDCLDREGGPSKKFLVRQQTIRDCYARATRIIADHQYKWARELVANYDMIGVEDLNLLGMTATPKPIPDPLRPGKYLRNGRSAKRGLNRVLRNARLGQMLEILEYMCKLAGVALVKVDPRNTSRRCNQCGHIAAENRESQAVFHCVECGHTCNADTNAARNIRDAAYEIWVALLAQEQEQQAGAQPGAEGQSDAVKDDESDRRSPMKREPAKAA